MTLNTMGRRATKVSIASILSLTMGLGLTACSNDYTVAYVYATTSQANPGLISGYKVDYQSGALQFLADSPIPSGGKNPVAIVAGPGGRTLYAIHRDDSTVVFFAIGTDGKLYAEHTYNTSGSFPTAAAIDAAGKFLYVTFTYQNTSPDGQPYTPASPGPGGVSVFAIATDGSLGTPTTVNVGRNPIGIIANGKNRNVYVIEQDTATTANLLGFSADATTGNLTSLPGVTINPGNVPSTGFPSGTAPSGIIEDSSSTHLYVTDQTANSVTAYSVAANGVPSLLANGTAQTDAGPRGMSFDLTGKYLYVVNYTGGTINGYTLGSNGQPVRSTVAGSVQAGTGPTCVTVLGAPIDTASHAVYLYTSNALSNTVSGLQLNPTDGSLRQIQNTPFTASTLPTCLVSVAAIPPR
jgi:6-phosphogluconolactonase